MEVRDVFEAYPTGSGVFLAQPAQGLYIPAYQREYSWDREHVARLLEDVTHGLARFVEHADTIVFIGTLITVHDTTYATVNPIVRGQVPSKVMTVIDGQQRLTTLCLLYAAIHDEVRRRSKRFAGSGPGDGAAWLHERSLETLTLLLQTLEADMSHGDGYFRYYPRIIRAFSDQCSRKQAEAKYTSDVANFLHSYSAHIRTDEESARAYVPKGAQLASRYKIIVATVRGVAKGDLDDAEIAPIAEFAKARFIVSSISNEDRLPDHVLELVLSDGPAAELFRLLALARFALTRVAVTVGTARVEDYAFDMFDALNTTGQPLTAFETFLPRVIEAEGIASYEASESRRLLEPVKAHLDGFEKADARLKATGELLIPFALAEYGHKLSKRLNEQRRFLRDRYERCETLADKHGFAQQLADVSAVSVDVWGKKDGEKPGFRGLSTLSADTVLGLDLLRKANHSIVVAPLARFYSVARSDHKKKTELERVARGVAAFFVLWRGSHRGTSGIDDIYRLLMRGDSEQDIPPLARNLPSESDVSVERILAYLRGRLADEGVGDKDGWTRRASSTPIYKENQPTCRFLLLAALSDTVADDTSPGLRRAGRRNVLPLFNFNRWASETTLTVEHVTPQTRHNAWDSAFYADPESIHVLGNLTLVPRVENVQLSNRPWEEKRAILRVLGASSAEDAATEAATAEQAGISIPTSAITRDEYLPLADEIGQLTSWTPEFVQQRSQRLAELAWDRLTPWLGPWP